MKKIFYSISSITSEQLNATEYTYYITFPAKSDYAYSIRATEEGFWRMCALWKEAGYEVVEKS